MRSLITFCVFVFAFGCEEKSGHKSGQDIESTRYGNIVIEVKDILKASKEASFRLQGFGGHVIGNTMTKLRCDMTVRIEPKNLERFLEKLEELGHVLEKEVETRDILKHSLALQAQIASLQAFERRLLSLLDTLPKDIPSVLDIEMELKSVRDEIAKAMADLRVLDERQDYAVVDITLLKRLSVFGSFAQIIEKHPHYFIAITLVSVLFSTAGFICFLRFSLSRVLRKGHK